jgi:uncharacterized protein Yka (UPF0111/DUF47 family)
MYHNTYNDFVKQKWSKEESLPNKVSHMEAEFGKWKRDVFGSIQRRKANLMARLNGIQRKQYNEKHNKFLETLEKIFNKSSA